MENRAGILFTVVAVTLAMMGLAACSGTSQQDGAKTAAAAGTAMAHGPRNPAQKAAVSTPEAAPVKNKGDMKVVSSHAGKQYLYELMQQPDFASAFASMDGAASLPAWVRKGGTATPARTVSVDGQSRLLAQACKPHDCPSEQVALLYDKAGHSMQGVFVRDSAPGPNAGISGKAQFTWLGQPDSAVKAWLRETLSSR